MFDDSNATRLGATRSEPASSSVTHRPSGPPGPAAAPPTPTSRRRRGCSPPVGVARGEDRLRVDSCPRRGDAGPGTSDDVLDGRTGGGGDEHPADVLLQGLPGARSASRKLVSDLVGHVAHGDGNAHSQHFSSAAIGLQVVARGSQVSAIPRSLTRPVVARNFALSESRDAPFRAAAPSEAGSLDLERPGDDKATALDQPPVPVRISDVHLANRRVRVTMFGDPGNSTTRRQSDVGGSPDTTIKPTLRRTRSCIPQRVPTGRQQRTRPPGRDVVQPDVEQRAVGIDELVREGEKATSEARKANRIRPIEEERLVIVPPADEVVGPARVELTDPPLGDDGRSERRALPGSRRLASA